MSVYHLLVLLIVVIAGIAILQWMVAKSKISIPYPVMIVLYAVCAILAIGFLVSFAGFGPWAMRW